MASRKTESPAHERRCPTCDKPIDSGAGVAGAPPPGYPFCSERCRLIDLGRWLNEDYRVPTDERQ